MPTAENGKFVDISRNDCYVSGFSRKFPRRGKNRKIRNSIDKNSDISNGFI
ncbi:unnamed protein product, partial [Larinioides sclopetarius]